MEELVVSGAMHRKANSYDHFSFFCSFDMSEQVPLSLNTLRLQQKFWQLWEVSRRSNYFSPFSLTRDLHFLS